MTTALDVARWPPWLQDRPGSVSPASSALALRIPGAAGAPWLDARVYLALGADLSRPPTSWSWADITNYVRFASGISTTQGRPDESGRVNTSSASLVLDNTDGRFSRKNPNGPYYGLLSRNTPIWGTIDAGTGAKTRLAQFVNEWPSRWDPSQADATVPIKCAGIMRRLAQGGDPKSALRRGQGASGPTAWWPLEEGNLSTVGASGLAGGMATNSIVSPAVFGAAPLGLSGAKAGVDFSAGGSLTASTGQALAAAPGGWEYELVVAFKSFPTVAVNGIAIIGHAVSSGAAMFQGFGLVQVSGAYYFATYQGNDINNSLSYNPTITEFPVQLNRTYHLRGVCYQDATIQWFKGYVDGVASTNPSGLVATVTMATRFEFNPAYYIVPYTATLANTSFVSGLAFYSFQRTSPTTYRAGTGWSGETAVARVVRICQEERIPLVCTAATAPSPAMGAQPVGTQLEILSEAEAVDQGVLYETNWGLGYQTLHERVNQPVAMTLDMNLGQLAAPPEPADDDQRLRNRWRAVRTSGSVEAVAELTTGQLGTGVAGPGLYDDSVTVNVQADSQLPDQAGWRLHRDTIDEDRWPSIAIALHNIPAFIDTWCGLPWGARTTVAHPPGQMAPDNIDTIIEGWAEQWDQIFWSASLATAPYSTYRVGALAADAGDTSDFLLVLTADDPGPGLVSAVDAVATAWTISSSLPWTTNSEDFPRRMMWEGEEIRLTASAGAAFDNFGRTVAGGWGTADSGQAWDVNASTSVNGSQGLLTHAALNTFVEQHLNVSLSDFDLYVDVDPIVSTGGFTGAYGIRGRILTDAGGDDFVEFRIFDNPGSPYTVGVREVVDSAETQAANGTANVPNVAAGGVIRVRAQASGPVIRMKAYNPSDPEPSTWLAQLSTVNVRWSGRIAVNSSVPAGWTNVPPFSTAFDNFNVVNPVVWTVVRSVNGVAKSHPGLSVGRIINPGVLALA